MENWIEIDQFRGKYSISNLGRVRNNINGKIVKTKIKKSQRDGEEYEYLAILYKGRSHAIRIDKEVMKAFVPIEEDDDLFKINHKDGDTLNSNLDNLERLMDEEIINKRIMESASYKRFTEVYLTLGDNKTKEILEEAADL